MTVFLNLLFVFVAVLFFAGRLYETAFLLEEGTNFLVRGGIVSKPLMLAIVFLISVCCGVLIYSDKKPQVKKLKIPVGIFGMASGALIIVSAILSIVRIFTVTGGFLGFDMMLILGGVGLILYGLKGIKGKDSEKLPMVLTVLFPISLCMTTVTVNVQPLADTFYMYRGLSAITTLAFFLFLFKNAYSPSALSRPVLYVTALLNFLVSTSATLANVIGGLVTKTLLPADIAMNMALVILGAFSLFTAFYIVPSEDAEKTVKQPKEKRRKKPKYEEPDEYEDDEDYRDEFGGFKFGRADTEPAYTNPVFESDTQLRQVNKISEDTIAMLFAQKEEKQQQAVTEKAVKEVTTELAVTQAIEKQATRQIDAATAELKEMRRVKQTASKKEKSVFKNTGSRKPANTKTVYKAPKK